MASSSVSQDDVEVDFENKSRRSRIRTARARNINPQSSRPGEADEEYEVSDQEGTLHPGTADHDASPKPGTRIKEKRINRNNHMNKGKQQRDRRKLREKRRSTGVVHLPSTESTGGSTGEEDELLSMTAETRRNTLLNENMEKVEKNETQVVTSHSNNISTEHKHKKPLYTSTRNKSVGDGKGRRQHSHNSPSDLEADDEDNQDYDSLTMSDSTLSLVQPSSCAIIGGVNSLTTTTTNQNRPLTATRPTNGRPGTPTAENAEELLDKAQEENRRLLLLIEIKDHRISNLEGRLTKVISELLEARTESTNLRQENAALIRSMALLQPK